uniref:Uncharacterized protein n=1 Tax=Fagus sylvatica TaxID=28930 RepID=A0A2N9G9U9_FAGSY
MRVPREMLLCVRWSVCRRASECGVPYAWLVAGCCSARLAAPPSVLCAGGYEI